MNARLFLLLAMLSAAGIAAEPKTTYRQWFAGMLTPPRVVPALPDDFIVVSLSPEAKGTGEFDMYVGNAWAPAKTARHFEFGADRKLTNATEPLFHVVLSSEVGQRPGSDEFSNEKNIVRNYSSAGLKKVKSSKTKWGNYPVLSLTGERPDGSPIFVAWIGINSPYGWAIFVDYRVPQGAGHPSDLERSIWEKFLRDTKPVD